LACVTHPSAPQSHAALKSERDEVESRLRLSHQSDAEWKSKCADAQEALSVAQGQLASAASNRETLSQETSSLKLQVESAQRATKELEQQLAIAVSELTASSRQLSHAQAELRASNRRAEKAEETQMNLQSEGTTLMRSLDEMRPKIVQLTGEKLDLGEKISALEHALRGRDALVTQMEISLEQVREEKLEVEKLNRELALVQEKERISAQEDLAEQQKAYEELQAEIDVLRESLQAAQTDRATFHRRKSQHMEEIDRLASSSSAQAAELSTAQRELEERREATEEARDVLERAQNEIESLRFELASKDEELERLRVAVSSAPSPTTGHRSLDGEIVSALSQQHALDLSAAQSNIRALETTIFEAQAHSHSLQKQVSALEDELAQIQNSPKPPPRPFSPRFLPSSPPASTQARSTHGLSKPNKLGPPPSRSVFDDVMTPETRHKRKVSLSMLKARIESEAAAASSLTRNPSSRALSPIPQQSSHPPPVLATAVTGLPRPHQQRPQFLDEVHVFWCHSCRGDLVIL
jgi:chromosome segregation ATPase